MKRRIDELLNGIYEYDAPQVEFSIPSVTADVRKGETFAGTFTIKNSAQKKIRGFLYSSDARLACSPVEFAGIEPRISFDVDFTGMKEEEQLSGEITVCTNFGEHKLPFSFTLKAGRARAGREVPESLLAFTELAKEDYGKAYGIFSSEAFARLIYEKEQKYGALYEGVLCREMEYGSMEEFLIGAGAKKPMHFSLDSQGKNMGMVKGTTKEQFQLQKEGWGFCRMTISADADFLELEHEVATTDDFIGSVLNISYLVHPEKLHAGNNYGRIQIQTELQTLQYDITVKSTKEETSDRMLHRQRKAVEKLYRTYIDFRLKKRNINSWISRSEEYYEEYEKAGGRDTMLKLYRAQLYFAAEMPEKACTILEDMDQDRSLKETPAMYGYRQYLTTFYHKDAEYVDYVEETIRDLYMQNQEEWVLSWIQLYLREDYLRHPSQKLEAIKEQFLYGCRSRIMYVEAWYVLEKTPMLLKKLDTFEIQILKFLCKEDLLTKDMIMQIADLVSRSKAYSRELYEILCCCYTKYASKPVLNAICSLLMNGHQAGEEYFNWYEKGVADGLRLTGLYEYYVESMGRERGGVLPQMIRMYFAYHNTLGYEKKAIVYANIIGNKEKDPHTFETYRPIMEKFMLDQLEAGKINRELACIYQTFLHRSLMNSLLAKQLAKALFTCEIQCEHEQIGSVAVVHRQLRDIQRVNLTGGKANVQIYAEDAQILLIDKAGHIHAGSIPYTVSWLMRDERMVVLCRELAADSPGFLLWFCQKAQNEHRIGPENIKEFCRLLEYEDIKENYKNQIRMDILTFYLDTPKEDSLYAYLHAVDLEGFIRTDKDKTVRLLTAEGMCREAFQYVSKYGPEGIDCASLTRMCSHCILEDHEGQEEMLLYLSAYCFLHGKYDETILTFLIENYDGPLEHMKELWRAGRAFELDTFVLEEKLLLMMLFTRVGLEGTEEIFESYRRKLGKKMLLQGYVNLMSYAYFVKGMPVKEPVFTFTRRGMEKGKFQETAAALALLLNLCKKEVRTKEEEECMVSLLGRCIKKNLRFAFFEDIPGEAAKLLQLSDRRFVEYRTSPEAVVTVHYHLESAISSEERERSEQMQDMYEGIFVKEFTLFADETLIYHIVEERDGEIKETPEYRLQANLSGEAVGRNGESRYELLNRMCQNYMKNQDEEVKKAAVRYLEQEQMIEKLCTLL